MQRTFLVFDPDATVYTTYVWQDGNANGVAETGEADLLWQKSLPCDDKPCIKFDNNGFSMMGPGVIYLTRGE